MRFITILVLITSAFGVEHAAAQTYKIQYSSTCTGTPVIFNCTLFETASSPDSISWNFGDAASGLLNTAKGIQQPLHAFTSPGTYTVSLHVVDSKAGTIDVTEAITIVPPIAYNFGQDVFICGDTGTYVLTAPAVANATYEWNDDSLSKTPTVAVTQTGAYTVKINGCAVTDTVGVFFTKQPHLDLGKDHVLCSGEQLTLSAANENATYQWWLNGATLNTQQSQVTVVAPGGQYTATINAGACGIFSDTVNITFNSTPAPAFSLGTDTLLCPKAIFNLTASVAGATAYSWSTKGLDVNDSVDYNIKTGAAIAINTPGRYWVFAKIGNQCEVVDTIIVRYRGDKQLNFNDTSICKGNTLILDADFGTGTYKWESFPPQRDDQNNTNQSTYYVYNPGLYSVTATVGHCVFKDSLHVFFNDSLQLALPRDTTLCLGETLVIHPVTNTNDFTWQDGTKSPTFVATQTNQIRIAAQNGCGKDTATMNIVFENCPCSLLLPNAFTPNGDGVNDYFRPLHACDMKDYNMTVFDRYGEKIYFTKDPLLGWDGKIKTKSFNPGIFVWIIQYTRQSTGQRVEKKGSVLLLR